MMDPPVHDGPPSPLIAFVALSPLPMTEVRRNNDRGAPKKNMRFAFLEAVALAVCIGERILNSMFFSNSSCPHDNSIFLVEIYIGGSGQKLFCHRSTFAMQRDKGLRGGCNFDLPRLR